ncbi:hypothetical protein [Variovorax sp. KBW07]|uniref:hypothetical protein n=1 Tax=Variovorax sp. KBW07 TaxID=2153358 RepID=UPI000F588993|nr:hypothetical protein [Variovorax sp. KBW07]
MSWCFTQPVVNFIRSITVFAMVAVVASGCTSVRQYEGPERAASEVSVLRLQRGSGAVINEIDGRFRGIGALDRHEFLPGRHTLAVQFMSAATGFLRFSSVPVRLAFDAKAGRDYVLITRTTPGQTAWTAWIVDVLTDEIVAEPEH